MITGLIGLRPQDGDRLVLNPLVPGDWDWFALDEVAYRGHTLSVVWDRNGSRYGRGPGLQVLVDGEVAAHSQTLGRLELALPEARPLEARSSVNWAVNNAPAWYPAVTASTFRPEAPPAWAVDGQYWYHLSPPNRWVPDSSRTEDWIELDFGVARPIDEVKLYLLDDTAEVPDFVAEEAPARVVAKFDGSDGAAVVAPPAAYRLEVRTAEGWTDVVGQYRSPAVPTGRRANTVTLPRTVALGLRVHLEHAVGTVSGLSELEVWGPAAEGLPAATATPTNLAFRAAGEAGPTVRTSYLAEAQDAALLNDGEHAFNYYTDKAWTTLRSASPSDWIEIAFGQERTVSQVELYLWAWESRGTAAPRGYRVQYWSGDAWADVATLERVPSAPMAMAVNTERFEPVNTERVRIVLQHALPAASSLTEIVVR